MDLKTFIKDTLTSIAEATVELQAELDAKGVIINPPRAKDYGEATADIFDPTNDQYRFRQIERVKFDVALTVSQQDSGRAGGGLKVAVLELGAGAERRNTSERASRVEFSIGMSLPPSKEEKATHKRIADRRESDQQKLAERKASKALREGTIKS